MERLPAIVRFRSSAREEIIGRTVGERVVRAALSAGAGPCIVVSEERPLERLLASPAVEWCRSESEARTRAGKDFVWIEADALFDPLAIRWAMEGRTIPLKGRPIAWRGKPADPVDPPGPWLAPVGTVEERKAAREWLFGRLLKENEGFMSRRFERPISLSITRLLCGLPVSPNAMTLVSAGAGLAGAGLLSAGGTRAELAGALLFWAHSVLDGCDGELARLKLEESKSGGALDYWSDNLVHIAVFAGIGLGLWRDGEGPAALALGAISAFFAAANAWRVGRGFAAKSGAGPLMSGILPEAELDPTARRVVRVQDLAARRDFIYLVVFAAAVGKLGWFLWAAAIGGAAYYAGLAWAESRVRA